MPLFVFIPLCVLAVLLSVTLVVVFIVAASTTGKGRVALVALACWIAVQTLAAGLYTYGSTVLGYDLGWLVAGHIIGNVVFFIFSCVVASE